MTGTPEKDQDREGWNPVPLTSKFLLSCLLKVARNIALVFLANLVGLVVGEILWHIILP